MALRLLRIALGLVFLSAALAKAVSFDDFAGSIFGSLGRAGFDYSQARWLAKAVVVLEGVAGMAVLLVHWVGRLRLCNGVFLGLFACWDTVRFLLNEEPDCGCFGGLFVLGAWWQVSLKHAVLAGLFLAYCFECLDGTRSDSSVAPDPGRFGRVDAVVD